MRITVLGSGSRGNATLVEAGGTRVLIDAGIPPRILRKRMVRALGSAPTQIDAVVLSHAHADHARHAEAVSKVFGATVWMTPSTQRCLVLHGDVRTRVFGPRAPFVIGGIEVQPLPVPHDAPQVALVLEHQGERMGHVTDLGCVPDALVRHFRGCRTVLVESNYDPHMLATGPYPVRLRARVAGPTGHLENAQTAALIAKLGRETDTVVLMHLSEKNNDPELARRAALTALGRRSVRLEIAHATSPLALPERRAAQLSLAW